MFAGVRMCTGIRLCNLTSLPHTNRTLLSQSSPDAAMHKIVSLNALSLDDWRSIIGKAVDGDGGVNKGGAKGILGILINSA